MLSTSWYTEDWLVGGGKIGGGGGRADPPRPSQLNATSLLSRHPLLPQSTEAGVLDEPDSAKPAAEE